MNLLHRVWCKSDSWARSVERRLLPWALADVDLGDNTLEIAFRVLQPGGVFAGSDGVPSIPFRIAHVRDTCNPVAPDTLPDRLRQTGFSDVHVDVARGEQRWRAVKPG